MSKDKRIILFGPWAPPYGGVSIYMRDLYENLKLSNFQVRILSYGQFVPENDVYRIYFSYRKWPLTLLKIFRYASPGDIVHNNSILTTYPNSYFLRTFLWLLKLKRLKWVETIHDGSLILRYENFSHSMKKRFPAYLSRAERIITIGERLRLFLVSIGVPEEKIVVSNPLLRTGFAQSDIEVSDDLCEFLESHSPIITTVGPFHPWYDFKTIVQAFLSLKHDFPEAGLIIINARFARDESYEKAVISLIEESPKHILTLCDLERERVFYILSRSKLFVRGHRHESFGLSRIEAIFAGTPVVAAKAGETRYMALYDHGNPDDLYKNMKAVLRGDIKIDMKEAQTSFEKMADETLGRITDIYRNIWSA